jgi:hypothetical protein
MVLICAIFASRFLLTLKTATAAMDEGFAEPAPLRRPAVGERIRRNGLAVGAAAVLIAVAALQLSGAGKPGDRVNATEAAQRAAALTALAPVPLRLIDAAEQASAIAAMKLPENDRSALVADLQQKRARLAWLTLYDTNDEDGDAVTIASIGFRQDVVLTKAPITIAVPMPPSGVITLTGLIDGKGGGVTVGVVSPAGPIPLPVMSVGQSIGIPVGSP